MAWTDFLSGDSGGSGSVDPWLFAVQSLLNIGPAQQAAGQARTSQELSQEELDAMRRRRKLYEPYEEEALGRLGQRMRTAPFYTSRWLGQASALRRPLQLNY